MDCMETKKLDLGILEPDLFVDEVGSMVIEIHKTSILYILDS